MKEFDLVGVATHRKADLYKKLSGKQYGTQLYVVMRLTEEGGNHVNILSEYPLTEHLKRDSRSSS